MVASEICVITVCSDLEREGFKKFKASLEKFGWEHVVIQADWGGFCTKVIETYNFLPMLKEAGFKAFVFMDAYDTVMLGTPDEFLKKLPDHDRMLFSAEKCAWPVAELASQYPECNTQWKYLNSGLYYAPIALFEAIVGINIPERAADDQLFFTGLYLSGLVDMDLDTECRVFQSYSFIHEGDFGYERNRLQNLETGTAPPVIHGNGKTLMDMVYDLIK